MHHQGENAHHGYTSIVELNGTLLELLLFREAHPTEVGRTVAKVTRKVSVAVNLTDLHFQKEDEDKELRQTSFGKSPESGKARRDVGELGAAQRQVPRDTNTCQGR